MLPFLRPRRHQLRELRSPPHRLRPMPPAVGPGISAEMGRVRSSTCARYGNQPECLPTSAMGGPGRSGSVFLLSRHTIWTTSLISSVDYRTGKLGSNGLSINTELPSRNTPFILAHGGPIPTDDGDDTLDSVIAYGAAQYPGNTSA